MVSDNSTISFRQKKLGHNGLVRCPQYNSPIKILAVNLCNAYGGLEKSSIELALAQARRGHDVLFICQKGTKIESAVRESGLAFRSFSYFRYLDVSLMYKIRQIVIHGGFRVVHAHKSEDLGVVAPALWGLRYRHLFFSPHMRVPAPKKDPYHFLEYGRVRRILANCGDCASSAQRNLPVEAEKVMEVPCVVDATKYRPVNSPRLRRERGFMRLIFCSAFFRVSTPKRDRWTQ